MTTDDMDLLREFARSGSEEAFALLVSRHVNLVHSVAMRKVGDAHLAEEITQAVFIILVRKAASLNDRTIVPAWLCRTAQYAAADALKIRRRRQMREQELHMQSVLNQNESSSSDWTQIAPVLDAAMAQLGERDHSAIVLRFFKDKSLREVGQALGVSENAAKTRVSRATEKLRKFFARRGIALSAVAIGTAITANSIQAAPIGLAPSITVAAVKGTSVAASTLTLIKTTMKIMAWTKIKTAAAVSAFVLLLAGGTGIVIHSVNAQADANKTTTDLQTSDFPGYATPEAALKSFALLQSAGDVEKAMTACTPEQAQWFTKKIEGKPVDEVRRRMADEAKIWATGKIASKETISEKEVRLHVQLPPNATHPNGAGNVQVFQRIGEEWKFAGIYGVSFNEKK